MGQDNSSTSRVRVTVLCLVLFALFVIAPAAFLSGGSKSNAAEQKGGTTGVAPSSTANSIAGRARLAAALQEKEPSGIQGGYSYKNDVSPPLRSMKQLPIVQKPEHEAADNPKIVRNHVDHPDPVVQSFLAPDVMPATILNFDGIPFPGVACNCAPPDTDGEVGLTQYVQIVNEGYQVFNKSTGVSQLGPSGIATVWAGFGGVCQNNGDGDPVVLYDQIANRWVISQFAGAGTPTDECIAVSQTSDATGSYFRYGFHLGANFFDYPKLGMWPDPSNNGYYMSDNVFNAAGTAFLGVQAFAFDRARMLAGLSAVFVTSGLIGSPANNGDPLLPADLDGSTLPPANTPCPFVEFPDTTGNNGGTYRTWLFHPDFVTPASSTFTQRTSPAAAGFTFACTSGRACVPQPAGTNVDGIGDRLMHRLPYRIIGGVERVVGNFTVSSGGVTGVRWFELRNVTSGSESVFQESTYQPDSTWRWMGSIAQDQNGDMALGFSASSATVFPSVRYAGRLVGDPAGTLGQGEAILFTGLGSQTGTGSRWGDYSAMSIDPVDDCTFWYTQEYYPAGTTSFNWRTRIGNFKFGSCNSTTPVLTSAGATLVSESCTPANGVIDPNETVTVSFCVQNIGGGNTTNLVGTLQNTGGVSGASGPQNYGVVVAAGPPVCRNFTFTASGTCGGTITATIQFQDGANNLGNITYNFTLGVLTTTTAFTENFDGVSAPALPAGWTTAATGAESAWVTSATTPNSAPNDAFAPDPGAIGNAELVTPVIAIPAGGASQLSFKNNYNTESTFDGMVLEISINGGAYADILAAGGSFAAGGYNATISSSFGSPIAGRMAWSGNSGGYITSTANLPAAASGQNIQLKWRMASDSSVSVVGVRIDDITISRSTYVCCITVGACVITCPANITKSNDPNQCGAVVTYPAPTSTGNCGTITCTPASGSFFPVGTTTVTCQAANGGGGQSTRKSSTGALGAGIKVPAASQPVGAGHAAAGGVTQQASGVPERLGHRAIGLGAFKFPKSPFALLYDQTDSLAASGTNSQNFEAAFDSFDDFLADDFVVPAGQIWTINQVNVNGLYFNGSGPANSVNVSFYPDSSTLPGSAEYTANNLTVTDTAGNFTINLPAAAVLNAGTHWVSVQANMDFGVGGEWAWTDRTVTSNSGAAWENPGGGFGAGCTPSWGRKTTCVPTTAPDQGFQLLGTTMPAGGGNGPTCTFTVKVNDTQPPTITCPANIFVAAAPSCPPATSRTVNYTVTATDNCPGVTVVCVPPSGSIFPVGTTTVHCTATDASGNTASCSFTVTVFTACLQDETNPGNVVLFDTLTGNYRFCCNGLLLASGHGVLTIRGCIGTITDQKGDRKVTITFDFAALKGTASLFLGGSTNPVCKITDQDMTNNNCACPSAPPDAVKK
jgi:hypothetical protein